MANERWQLLTRFWNNRPVELFADDNNNLVEVPVHFVDALRQDGLLDCTFLIMPQKPSWVYVLRGGREDFCIPISLLKHLRKHIETP